jgi:LPXTG-motif cell wall-anchored protein
VASNVLIVGQGVVTTVPPLPGTGSDSTGDLVRLGVGLLVVGGLVLLLTRRRATSQTPTPV